jgi:hypothetical protein
MTGFRVTRAWGRSRFCVDPDGYLVEIQEPG